MPDPTPTQPSADRNLLFGVLALQMDFVSRDDLIAAMNAWVLAKDRPLGQVLADRGALRNDERDLLDALVQKHLRRHGGDAAKSLAAVSTIDSVRLHLQQIADSDLNASLAHVSAACNGAADTLATQLLSAGTPTSSGPRFRVLRPHARGGLGEVFVARDEELGREVALKEIQQRYADHPDSRARFVLEAKLNGGLEHPGIVPVYGLGTYADGRPFYAMRLIRGDSLQETIQRFHAAERPRRDPGERALALRGLLGRFVDVCDAIAFAHSRGVLHRDLKPANVMLGQYGETLVVDWGLAKVVGRPDGAVASAEGTLRPASASGSAETQAGSALGTPQYMPPEQAAGRPDELGPASDVYSLGATLYCLLTGQAPVQGEDVGEVLRRVKRGEFPPPRQVKRDVPPALEAVCLKAMALKPQDRYPTPRALAADVEAWLADEPVGAWREPLRVWAGRWARRHKPAVAAAVAAALVLLVLGGAGAWWLAREAGRRQQAAELTLAEVAGLQSRGRWAEARVALDQAEHRLGEGGPADLRRRLAQARSDLDLVARLETVRLNRASDVEGHFNDLATTDRAYAAALGGAGLGEAEGDAAAAASWVNGSAVREHLVAFLDDWAACAERPQRRAWLLEVLRLADPDPWRDGVRDPAVWDDANALARRASGEQVAEQSPQLLATLGRRLFELRGDVLPLLLAAQKRHPGDFWINHELARVLDRDRTNHAEAIGYSRAALAIRPGTAIEHSNLSAYLRRAGRLDEALAEARKAVELDPKLAGAHSNLGITLGSKGQLDEALAECKIAVELDPLSASAHNYLGIALDDKGQKDEAIAEYRRAIELSPRDPTFHTNLGAALRTKGRREEAITEYRRAIKLDPRHAWAHYRLGIALNDMRQLDEALAEYRKASDLDPRKASIHTSLGHALKAKGLLDEAIAEYRRAIELSPRDARAHNYLGVALGARGYRDEAIAEYRKSIELAPRFARAHNNLGTALRGKGRLDEAIAEHRKALEFDPRLALAHNGLGLALAEKDDYAAGIAEFLKAIELDPKYAVAHNNLGWAMNQQGRYDEAIPALRKAIELDPRYGLPHSNLGGALRGMGQLDEAITEYKKAIELAPKLTTAHIGLGLALSDKGRLEEAIVEHQRAIELSPGVSAQLRSAVQHLRHCEQLLGLDRRLADFLDKRSRPANPGEQLSLGQLCLSKRRPAAAARFYADAFAARPGAAADLPAGHRYGAARSAALAAVGRGEDAAGINEEERAHFRRQALGWLRADLALWEKQAASSKPTERAAAQKSVRRWQQSPDLAELREPAAVAKLPETERADWQKLWADVAALRKKAAAGGKE